MAAQSTTVGSTPFPMGHGREQQRIRSERVTRTSLERFGRDRKAVEEELRTFLSRKLVAVRSVVYNRYKPRSLPLFPNKKRHLT